MSAAPLIVLFIVYFALLFGSELLGKPHPLPRITGYASWYGAREAGKKMANGRPFDPTKLTCASNLYPFGTRLRVTYPITGKVVVVTVTDRGPSVPGRILDLSAAAAVELGMLEQGVGLVSIVPLEDK